MEINDRTGGEIVRRFFRREKKARGGDFCEEREREAEVHSGHIIPAIRREEEEGGGGWKALFN